MVFFYYLAIFAAISYCLYYYFTRTFNYWKNRNVAGPKPVPFFGNIKESALRRKVMGTVLREIYEQYPNEKVIGFYRMTTPCLIIKDLEVLKHILIKDFNIFSDRGVEFSKEGLGVNLFHSDGTTWRGLRNRMSPIFTSGKIRNMFSLMIETADKFTQELQQACIKNPEQEMHKLVQRFTLATISSCAFGLGIESIEDKLDTLRFIDDNVVTANIFNELDMMYPGLLKKLNLSLFPMKVKKFFSDLTNTIVIQRNGMPSSRKDLMDSLLELRNQKVMHVNNREEMSEVTVEVTDDIIAAQAFLFYIAGYETSATTLAYMIYHIALNPDVQDKLIAEIDGALKNNGGKITYESLMEMPFLNQVFDETLRMYPVLDPLQRNASVDYKIPDTDVTIEKGTTVVIPVTAIHYDEKNYPNPTKFDPSRFNLENSRGRHPCAYLPFGEGPRNCIGKRFAKVQSTIAIVTMFSKFRVEPSKNTPDKIRFKPTKLLQHPLGGIPLKVVPRVGK